MLMRTEEHFIDGEAEAQKWRPVRVTRNWTGHLAPHPSSSPPHTPASRRTRPAPVRWECQEETSFLTEGCGQTAASI